MRGSGENRGASFSCPCLLAPLPFPSPSPFFVSSSVSSCRRLVSRLVLLVEGRGVVVLVLSFSSRRHRSRSAFSSLCLSRGGAMDAARSFRYPVALPARACSCSSCGGVAGMNTVSSPVPCLLVEGRGGICVGIVDCPIDIYNLPVSWYLIGVERETDTNRKELRNDDQDQHPHHQLPLLRDRV